MKNIAVILLSFFVFFACNNDSANQSTHDKEKGNSQIIEQTNVLLFCQPIAQADTEFDAPAHEVFLQLAESKVKVADILNCETISPSLFEQYQIPKKAISAVGGWWAGAGDYLYIIEEENNYVVKQGGIFEESEDGNYNYQVVAKYSKTGKEVF